MYFLFCALARFAGWLLRLELEQYQSVASPGWMMSSRVNCEHSCTDNVDFLGSPVDGFPLVMCVHMSLISPRRPFFSCCCIRLPVIYICDGMLMGRKIIDWLTDWLFAERESVPPAVIQISCFERETQINTRWIIELLTGFKPALPALSCRQPLQKQCERFPPRARKRAHANEKKK